MPECNSFGLALMGGAPLSQAFTAVRDGAVDAIVILENDLYRRAPAQSVDASIERHAACDSPRPFAESNRGKSHTRDFQQAHSQRRMARW